MLALVTGASSGIGLEYAKNLAGRGYDLVIASNQAEAIEETGRLISASFGVRCDTVCIDLTEVSAPEALYGYCTGKGVLPDILINNAGVFFFNNLEDTSASRVDLMIALHVRAVTQMCRIFGKAMAERGSGYILNMSSMSAWMTFPGISVYNATKSYILNLSRSLWYEFRSRGVTVTAVCPGAVDTGLYGLSAYWRKVAVRIGVSMPPDRLAEKALSGMFRKRKTVVPGAVNRILFIPVMKHIPDFVVSFAQKKLAKFRK